MGQQVQLNLADHLALDQKVGVEGKRVLGDVHAALDGVLDGHEPKVSPAVADHPEHLRDGRGRGERVVEKVGLTVEGLLGEGPGRAQIGQHRLVHGYMVCHEGEDSDVCPSDWRE